jgi:hypothetical protein
MNYSVVKLQKIGVTLILVALLICVFAAQAAAFSATPVRTFPIGSFPQWGGYAPGFDGTFWTIGSGGGVGHVDDVGNDRGDGFSSGIANPQAIGYYGGRIYVPNADGGKLKGIDVGAGHTQLSPDSTTLARLGNNQRTIRTYSNGGALMTFGQDNKVGALDFTNNASISPWYPQAFHGVSINTPGGTQSLESCVLTNPPATPGEECGKWSGLAGPSYPGGFNRPSDIAPGPGGSLFISEQNGNRITTLIPSGASVTYGTTIGHGPGSAAGELDAPFAIAHQASTNYIYVSEQGNRRISVFTTAGGYIASFGYGVLDGANTMQVCGVGIGACRAGVVSSSWGRLDFLDGQLYAYMPGAGTIQVFDVGGAPGTGAPPPPLPGVTPKEKVRIKASSTKIKKGKKLTLTATVSPTTNCATRKVLFQVQDGRKWNKVKTVTVDKKKCLASVTKRVTKKHVYRAALINSTNSATLGYSSKVTVSVKNR